MYLYLAFVGGSLVRFGKDRAPNYVSRKINIIRLLSCMLKEQRKGGGVFSRDYAIQNSTKLLEYIATPCKPFFPHIMTGIS